MTSVDSNFNFLCGCPHGAGPPPPVHMRPPEPDPLRVDVINGWPQTLKGTIWNAFLSGTCSTHAHSFSSRDSVRKEIANQFWCHFSLKWSIIIQQLKILLP